MVSTLESRVLILFVDRVASILDTECGLHLKSTRRKMLMEILRLTRLHSRCLNQLIYHHRVLGDCEWLFNLNHLNKSRIGLWLQSMLVKLIQRAGFCVDLVEYNLILPHINRCLAQLLKVRYLGYILLNSLERYIIDLVSLLMVS